MHYAQFGVVTTAVVLETLKLGQRKELVYLKDFNELWKIDPNRMTQYVEWKSNEHQKDMRNTITALK